jgi:hypothetical protein
LSSVFPRSSFENFVEHVCSEASLVLNFVSDLLPYRDRVFRICTTSHLRRNPLTCLTVSLTSILRSC